MCGCRTTKQGCQKPEKLEGKPGECSPEQVKRCHGDVSEHPCAPKKGTAKVSRK